MTTELDKPTEPVVKTGYRTLAVILLSLYAGSALFFWLAVTRNGENGNAVWYLLFWVTCTGLFVSIGILLAKLLRLRETSATIVVAILSLFGVFVSSPMGLLNVFALPVLFIALVSVPALLAITAVKAVKSVK